VKLVSTSDLTGAIYLVCTIFVCYACMYVLQLLTQGQRREFVGIICIVFPFCE